MFTDIYQPNTIRNQVNGKLRVDFDTYLFHYHRAFICGLEAFLDFMGKYEIINKKITL